eukprot:230704_1
MLMKHIFICAILRFYQFIKNSYYIITYIIFKQFEKSKSPKNKTQYGFNRLMELHNTNQINITLPPKLALVTDLDRTLVGKNDNDHNSTYKCDDKNVKRFNDLWCTKYASNNCVLIYATGRSLKDYKKLIQECNILKPDILISADGCGIHWFNKSLAQQVQANSTHKIDLSFNDAMNTKQFIWYDSSWEAVLTEGWNKDLSAQILDEIHEKFILEPFPKSECLESFRIGVKCKGEKAAKEVEQYYIERVNEYNKLNEDNQMNVHTFTCIGRIDKTNTYREYWSTMTSENAGKGSAVEFLRKRLKLNEKDVICMGDSGNDISMLGLEGYNSVIMANSSKSLLKFYEEKHKDRNMIRTKQPSTLGVIEGLQYYGTELLKH